MTRLPIIAAAALAIAASAPVLWTTTSPASAHDWGDRSDMADRGGGGDTDSGDLRDLLRDRIRTRADLRDLIIDLLQDRRDLRERMRERMNDRRSGWHGADEDEEGGGLRGRLRERLAERMADRHHGEEEGGGCYFLTRSLRDEDGDFVIIVRRRICRD